METLESLFQKKLNAVVTEKLIERKKQLMENPVACNCVSEYGQDCGCGSTKKHDGVAEGSLNPEHNTKMISHHKKQLEIAGPAMTAWHQSMIDHHEREKKQATKESYSEEDGRQVYLSTPDGAYDELHGKKEGGPRAPDQYSKEMNIGKSDNVNDGYRAGSQKAFETWKSMSNKEKALFIEGDCLQTPEDAMDQNTLVDPKRPVEEETGGACMGSSGLGGMDSTDGMLFGKTANKSTQKGSFKKKVWNPSQRQSLAVLKPY